MYIKERKNNEIKASKHGHWNLKPKYPSVIREQSIVRLSKSIRYHLPFLLEICMHGYCYFFRTYNPSLISSFSSDIRPERKLCSCWRDLSYEGSATQNIWWWCRAKFSITIEHNLVNFLAAKLLVLLTFKVLCILSNVILPKFVSIPTMNFWNKKCVR